MAFPTEPFRWKTVKRNNLTRKDLVCLNAIHGRFFNRLSEARRHVIIIAVAPEARSSAWWIVYKKCCDFTIKGLSVARLLLVHLEKMKGSTGIGSHIIEAKPDFQFKRRLRRQEKNACRYKSSCVPHFSNQLRQTYIEIGSAIAHRRG